MTMLPEQIDTFSRSAASKNSFDKMFCCDHTYPVLCHLTVFKKTPQMCKKEGGNMEMRNGAGS